MNALLHRLRRAQPARRAYWLVAVLTALLMLAGNAIPAFALPPEPLDPEPSEFPPPANGFMWTMAPRYGLDQDGNGVTDYHTELEFVNPASFKVFFKGCPSWEERSLATRVNRYRWKINGAVIQQRNCDFSRYFAQGTYTVELTVSNASGVLGDYSQQVRVRDFLIVALGDSFASGEGNPDVPAQWDGAYPIAGARWVDGRCHRSAAAGSAQAALALEQSSRQSSVTFVSLACSGAGINVGLQNGYVGIEHGPTDPPLPAQLDALRAMVGSRRIDALLISAGGNDAGFGDVVAQCAWEEQCHTLYSVYNPVAIKLGQLAGVYDSLTDEIARGPDGAGPEPGLNVAAVYFLQYPNLLRDAGGYVCEHILDGVVPGRSINFPEAAWAETSVLYPLNNHVQGAVDRAVVAHPGIQWHVAGGMMEAFAGTGYGHGYCAGDQAWVRTIQESLQVQGDHLGAVHPDFEGHTAYKQRIEAFMLPRLAP
jgi:hypothetical protein